MKKIIVFSILVASFVLVSCVERNDKQQYNISSESVLEKGYEVVPAEKVCMVNDRFMGVTQIPVLADGTTYYGCCENCVKKLQGNIGGVRYAKDPVSGEKVDKAHAVILQNKEDGYVHYFSSQATAQKFMNQ
ncbi:MAG: hypothetical protein R3B93_06225 [Bacteroidia bacterium]